MGIQMQGPRILAKPISEILKKEKESFCTEKPHNSYEVHIGIEPISPESESDVLTILEGLVSESFTKLRETLHLHTTKSC
jgi:hypothetical protein